MEAVDLMLVSSVDSSLSKVEILRGVVSEKLTTVARDIFKVVERTVAGYEEEAAGLREQILRQKKQLEALLQPRVSVFRIDGPACDANFAKKHKTPVEEKEPAYGDEDGSWDEFGPVEEEEEEEVVDDEWEGPVQAKNRKCEFVNLRICHIANFQVSTLSRCVLKSPMKELRCRRDLNEANFMVFLRSTFPDLTENFDTFTVDLSRTFKPLKLMKVTPQEIQKALKSRGKGRSALYIRGKEPREPHTKTPSLLMKEDAIPIKRRYRRRANAIHTSLRKKRGRKTSLISLRVCLLKDSDTNRVHKGVFKSRVKEFKCPRNLQETEFLNLLRSSFPQLTNQFDAFTTDASKILTPLRLQTLTPEKIERIIKSRGKGRSALYIREKTAEDSQSHQGELAPLQIEEDDLNDTSNDDEAEHLSSHNRPVEEEVSNKSAPFSTNLRKRDSQGISKDLSPPSAESLSDLDKEGVHDEIVEDDGDEEWKSDDNDESKLNPDSSQIKRRQRMRLEKKRRKRIQTSTPVSCKVCQALSGSQNILIKHSWMHVDDPERLCGVCGHKSESVEELRSHLESHQKIHSCKVCGKSFLSPVSLKRHESLHTGEKPYKCDICDKAYVCKNSLISHHWEHMEDKQHTCDVCGQAFAFKQQLKVHSRTHLGRKTYSCDVCGKTVSNLRSLSRHKLIHFGVKRYGCKVCGKRFLTHKNAKVHEKIHTDRDKSYLCDICCKQFHKPGQLKIHLKTHSKDKVTCDQCGKGLSTRGALKRHMVIHTGERAFKCSDCGQDFKLSGTLRDHRKVHSKDRPFVCGICGKASYRKAHLIAHMRTHNGEKPYKCSICGRGFTQSHCLKTHIKCHQREDHTQGEELKS